MRLLDPAVDRVRAAVDAVPEPVRDGIGGDWLGIPLHPVLTDVTIGAWTGSFVADVIGGPGGPPVFPPVLLLRQPRALPPDGPGLARLGPPHPAPPPGRV